MTKLINKWRDSVLRRYGFGDKRTAFVFWITRII